MFYFYFLSENTEVEICRWDIIEVTFKFASMMQFCKKWLKSAILCDYFEPLQLLLEMDFWDNFSAYH